MGPRLGVLLCDPALLGKAIELLGEGDALFLMDEGVRADVRALTDGGVEVTLCAMDAEARGVKEDPHGARFGSQYDHAVMIRDARRIVSLAGGAIEDRTPPEGMRHVAVRTGRKPAQALRAAVG